MPPASWCWLLGTQKTMLADTLPEALWVRMMGRNWARNLQFEIKDPWYQHDVSLYPARGRGCKRWRSKAASHCCGWVSSSLCLLTSSGMVAQGIYARFICPVTGCKRFSAADSEGCWKSQGPNSWGQRQIPTCHCQRCQNVLHMIVSGGCLDHWGYPATPNHPLDSLDHLSTETHGKIWGSSITISRNPHTEVGLPHQAMLDFCWSSEEADFRRSWMASKAPSMNRQISDRFWGPNGIGYDWYDPMGLDGYDMYLHISWDVWWCLPFWRTS